MLTKYDLGYVVDLAATRVANNVNLLETAGSRI